MNANNDTPDGTKKPKFGTFLRNVIRLSAPYFKPSLYNEPFDSSVSTYK